MSIEFIISFTLECLGFLWLCIRTLVRSIGYAIYKNKPRKEIKNSNILITGTASGLGKLLADRFACDGNTLHLVDINSEMNEGTKESLQDRDCTVHTYHCDVRSIDSITQLRENVLENCSHLDYLINNAGVMVGKLFHEESIAEINMTMEVNALGPMMMTKIFLPEFIEHGGHLVYVCSTAGQCFAAFSADYCASKHAITGFIRTLKIDLEYRNIHQVKMTTVFPHMIDTGLATGCIPKLPLILPMLQPDWVADQIVTATKEEVEEIFLPRTFPLALLGLNIVSPKVMRKFGLLMGSDLMKDFRQTREHSLANAL